MAAPIHGASVNHTTFGNKGSEVKPQNKTRLLRRSNVITRPAIQPRVWMHGYVAKCDVKIVPAARVRAGAGIKAERIFRAQRSADAAINLAKRAGFAKKIKSATGST